MKLLLLNLMALMAVFSDHQATRHAASNESEPPSASIKAAIAFAGRLTDAANIFSVEQEAVLTGKLALLERTTGHQMVVATVNSLDGRDVADFARDLGNARGIGREGLDDGVVVLVAPSERKIRVAVGNGLERILSDSICKIIIEQNMLPYFEKGDYYEGIDSGVSALIERLMPTG